MTEEVPETSFSIEVQLPDGSLEQLKVMQRYSAQEVKGAISSGTNFLSGKDFHLVVQDEIIPDDAPHFLSAHPHITEMITQERSVLVSIVTAGEGPPAHGQGHVRWGSVDSDSGNKKAHHGREKSNSAVDKVWGFVSKRTSNAMKAAKTSVSRGRADSGQSSLSKSESNEYDSEASDDDEDKLEPIDEDGYVDPDNLDGLGNWVFGELNKTNKEVAVFHQRMQRLGREEVHIDPFVNVLPFFTVRETNPRGDDAKQIVKCHLPDDVFFVKTSTVQVDVNNNADEAMLQIFNRCRKLETAAGVDHRQFVFKVTGLCEYLHNTRPLRDNNYVQDQMKHKKNLELTIISLAVAADADPEAEAAAAAWDSKYNCDVEVDNEFDGEWIDTRDIYNRVRLRISAVDRLKVPDDKGNKGGSDDMCWVTAGIFYGGECLCPLVSTGMMPLRPSVRFYTWKTFDVRVHSVPRAARLCVTVWGGTSEIDKMSLGWANLLLFDHKDEFITGSIQLNLWPRVRGNPIGTCSANPRSGAPVMYLDVDQYQLPVFFRQFEMMPEPVAVDNRKSTAKALDKATMALIQSDPLVKLTEDDKKKLWASRNDIHVRRQPKALAKVLASCQWEDRQQVMEAYQLLQGWSPFDDHFDALELLDARFADVHVRKCAVEALEALTDVEVKEILLQLTQAIKYEPYHNSYLARFLMKRALANPGLIGHYFFWYMKAELHNPMVKERFGIFVSQYLLHCGKYRAELLKCNSVINQLDQVAKKIKKKMKSEDRKRLVIEELKKVKFPKKWQLPLDSRFQVSGLRIEKCRYMDSKKMPLWLVFENADTAVGGTTSVIFKSGDDLRQDILTLQMIRIMDKFWKEEDLDMRMKPYGCIATGDGVGMLEVVLDSETVAEITKDAGGVGAVVNQAKLADWLRSKNEADHQYDQAVETFMYSCAGYCVATFVLGIGDRHNDNIMLSKYGHLFHIDFGHFLGNFKSKWGVRRERAPFVMLPDFAYILGGKDSPKFREFEELCCRAFNILRKHAHLFINLFILMLSTGIPELQTSEDILWLKDMFVLDKSDDDAAVFFKKKLQESLSSKATLLLHGVHILAH